MRYALTPASAENLPPPGELIGPAANDADRAGSPDPGLWATRGPDSYSG